MISTRQSILKNNIQVSNIFCCWYYTEPLKEKEKEGLSTKPKRTAKHLALLSCNCQVYSAL